MTCTQAILEERGAFAALPVFARTTGSESNFLCLNFTLIPLCGHMCESSFVA